MSNEEQLARRRDRCRSDVLDVQLSGVDLSMSTSMLWPMSTSSFRSSGASPLGEAAIPSYWAHRRGPVHHLLVFQDYRCAVCETGFTWDTGSGLVPRQWVRDGLLQALVCYGCSRRYTGQSPKAPANEVIASNLDKIAARPPAQQCPATRGLGRQSAPRPFKARLARPETPTPAWSYHATITHALVLWQRGRCAICSTGLQVTSRPLSVHLDHDPDTGLIRGLLCHRCNVALGKQDLQPSWWAHNEPFMRHYLQHPPAQVLPATRGKTYGQGHQPAEITITGDGTELLYGGLPRSILDPGVVAWTRPHPHDDPDHPADSDAVEGDGPSAGPRGDAAA